jgi:hypothetical protein
VAVVVIATTPGMSGALYDRSQQLMDLEGTLPEGCSAHITGPGPDGWRVVAVWESAEAARDFMATKLGPALTELGVTPPAVPPVIYPLHAQIG